ncbi:MAG: DUF3365 domain-containing protein, partial [Desulfobacterales bacterium]|nr:DUF3365 domain-containing protein [Desulfobacterales bacterium]
MQNKFFLTIVLVIVPVLGVIFSWVGLRSDHNAKAQIVNQARILARQIILTRQWVADCGGVMVPRGSEGARKMIYFLDDRLKTSRGILNRFTPAMVTKKLSQYSLRENMYHFRLASLNPMNPGNNPDAFERMALLQFIHNNTKEVYHIEKIDGKPTFRYTVPLYVDKACLDCHQNFTRGSIGGCLSFFLPIKQALKSLKGT